MISLNKVLKQTWFSLSVTNVALCEFRLLINELVGTVRSKKKKTRGPDAF